MHLNESRPIKAYFLSFVGPDYSRTSVLLNFESALVEKHYLHLSTKWHQMIRELIELRKNLNGDSLVIIMSPAHKITFLARLLTGKKLFLDAGWPLTDGALSRGVQIQNAFRLLSSYLLDFLSFHSACITMVESQAQLHRVNRLFVLPKKRLKVRFTGVNESAFIEPNSTTTNIAKLNEHLGSHSNRISVLFRGRINNESGIESIIAAARVLENEVNFIFVTGQHKVLLNLPSNSLSLSDVTENEMAQIYGKADIALGQISSHRRLSYTIPHKAFEAGYFGKCYVSPGSLGLLELYPENSIHLVDDASAENLVAAIQILKDSNLRHGYEKRISENYQQKASQKVLNIEFEELISSHQFK